MHYKHPSEVFISILQGPEDLDQVPYLDGNRPSRRLDELYEKEQRPARDSPRFENRHQERYPRENNFAFDHIDPKNPGYLNEDLYSEDFDDYNDMNRSRAYSNPALEFRVRKGNLVRFYRNGDPNFKGLTTSVSQKQFATFETLLVWLNEKISTTAGVKYIFQIPDGKEIRDIADFIAGRSYVVSSVRKIKHVDYGASKERFWQNKAPSAGKIRKQDHPLFSHDDTKKSHSYPGSRTGSLTSRSLNGYSSPALNRPRILTIRSNTNRESKQKVIFNPQTTQTFEEMLSDISGMVKMEFPPVTALWTSKAPQRQVSCLQYFYQTN